MKQLFQKSNILKTLVYFFENPYKEEHLREIARKTKISPSTLSRTLAMLTRDGLIQKREEKHATFFKATMSNIFKSLKISYTLSIIENKKIIKYVQENSSGISSFILYGSSARGEDDQDSDYDFLIISGSSNVKADEISTLLGRECSIKKFNLAQWKDVSRNNRAFYLEVITSSIALFGNIPIID
jgi:predicted nucleotidyltransferase